MITRGAAVGLLLLAACGGALSGRLSASEVETLRNQADARTQRSLADARAKVLREQALTELTLVPRAEDGHAPGVISEAGQVAFVRPSCAQGQSCGCVDAPLLFARAADDTVVVVAFAATNHTQRVKQSGSCMFGCGQPSPREPDQVWPLPTTDAAKVRFVTAPYDTYSIAADCERTDYAP